MCSRLVQGTLVVAGWSLKTEIAIEPTKFLMSVEADPINLGIIKLTRSRQESTLGPKFFVQAQLLPPKIAANISVYAEIPFILGAGVHLLIDGDNIKFEVSTALFVRRVPQAPCTFLMQTHFQILSSCFFWVLCPFSNTLSRRAFSRLASR